MYVFSNTSTNAAVLNSIDNFNIQARVTGTVNGISFTDANIVGGSFSITNQCSSETELSIGQVYVGELNITLTGLNIDRYSLYGKQIIPTWGIYVNSAWRNVPLGTFIISEVEVVSLGLKIRAYDNMSLFDIPYAPTSLSGVPRTLANAACTACGVTLGTTATTFATFPNYNVTLNATQTTDYEGNKSIPEISTYRDVIHYIAQVTCTNATIDRSGKLIFVPYPSTAVASIDTSHRKMGGMTADFETYYDGIIVTDPATKAQTKYTRSNPTGLTMDLGDNPFINTAAIRNAILNALTFRFHPFRMDILNAPLYDLMDCIYLPDGIGDGTKLYCITKYIWTYHGSYQLSGAGQDPKLVAVTDSAHRTAAQAAFIASQKVSSDEMDEAIDAATAKITGNSGGYIVLHDTNGDGEPDELLVMNTPSISTATKVWRWNQSGLGYSSTGYSGTYGLAMTDDGDIVANRIKVGVLGDVNGDNSWDLGGTGKLIATSGEIGGWTIEDIYLGGKSRVPAVGGKRYYVDLRSRANDSTPDSMLYQTLTLAAGYATRTGGTDDDPVFSPINFAFRVRADGDTFIDNLYIDTLYDKISFNGSTYNSIVSHDSNDNVVFNGQYFYAGTTDNSTNEARFAARSSIGSISLYSSGTSQKGIWLAAHGTATAGKSIIYADTNNYTTVNSDRINNSGPIYNSDIIYAGTTTDTAARFVLSRNSLGSVSLQVAASGNLGIAYGIGAGVYNTDWLIYRRLSDGAVFVDNKTPVYTSTDQTIAGRKWFTNYPVVRGLNKGNFPRLMLAGSLSPDEIASFGTYTDSTLGNQTRLCARIHSYSSSDGSKLSYVEDYILPTVTADRTATASYNILTSKSAVTVAQGGTGATTQKDARFNLGIGSIFLKGGISTTEVTISSGYSKCSTGIVVRGMPGTTAYSTCFIPKIALSTSNTTYHLIGEAGGSYIIFTVRYSGNDLIIRVTTSSPSGKVLQVYGIN